MGDEVNVRESKRWTLRVACCLLVLLMLPGMSVSSDTAEDRINALEARIRMLEEQLDQFLSEQAPEEASEMERYDPGDTVPLSSSLYMTIHETETGGRFQYYPAGGFSSTTLSAKRGYRLLCVYATVENTAATGADITALLNAELVYGNNGGYTAPPRDSVFYINQRGDYAAGLTGVDSGAAADICLLFAIPEEAENSKERLSIRIQFGETQYECVVRDGFGVNIDLGEPADF